jgi:Tfp pilus assembly PilM family ATPase
VIDLFNLFKRTGRSAIGVDVGGRSIKALQLSEGPRGWQVQATASFARATFDAPLSRGELIRLAEVLRRRSFHGNKIVLAAPPERIVTGTMELPARVSGVALDAAARNEFGRAFKCNLDAAEMTFWDLPAPARASKSTHVMAIACAHSDSEELIDLCADAELDLVGLDMRSWAMARGCGPDAESDGVVILLELGWNNAVLVMIHGGVVIYERALAEGGIKHLEDTLAEQLRIAPHVTQYVLSGPGIRNDAAGGTGAWEVAPDLLEEVRGVISAHFDAVSQELLASISYTTHQYPNAPVSRLLLLGGGAMIPGVAEYMRMLGFECLIATPLGGESCSPEVARECTPSLTTAAGLAQFNEW